MLKLVRIGRKEEAFYTFDWVSEGGYSKNGYFVLVPCSSNITYCKLILEAIHPNIRGREWGIRSCDLYSPGGRFGEFGCKVLLGKIP